MPTNKPSASNANNAAAAFSAGLVLPFITADGMVSSSDEHYPYSANMRRKSVAWTRWQLGEAASYY